MEVLADHRQTLVGVGMQEDRLLGMEEVPSWAVAASLGVVLPWEVEASLVVVLEALLDRHPPAWIESSESGLRCSEG